MINELYTEQQRQKILQKQILMYGGSVKKQPLNVEEIKKLEKDYRTMFIGFTSINWSKPGTKLGTAWQKALSQMESYIKTKSKIINHPVYEQLMKYHAMFSKKQSEHIMKCQGRESETVLTKDLQKVFLDDGTKMASNGKKALDSFYQQYMPKQSIQELPVGKKFEIIKQNIQQSMIFDLFTKNRAA